MHKNTDDLQKNKRIYTVLFSNLSKEDFLNILRDLKLSKAQLAREMGIAYSTVKSWYVKDKKMPLYVERYLFALKEIQKYKNIEKDLKSLKKAIEKL